ncbi:MAG: phage integrase SAM-like domain-containing protein [Alistipes sp.]|nr:phage integrase SAM-like domain-containing protein [Alistipes sp.]
MATIYLSLSAKYNAVLNAREIMVRFSHGKINQRAKSGIFVQPDYWDVKNECVLIPRLRLIGPEQRRLLDELNAKQSQIEDMRMSIMTAFVSADYIDKGWLDNVLHPNKKEACAASSFFATWGEFIESRHVSKQRKAMYSVVRDMLYRYEQVAKVAAPKFRLSLDDITATTINKFESFLQNEHLFVDKYPHIYKGMKKQDLPRARGGNTLSDRISILRTFYLWAIKNDLTKNDPFKNVEIKAPVYGTPIYITIEERNQILNTDMPSASLNAVRDIFVFQCLIGCRVGDLLRMTKANIVNNAIEYIPRKTKDGHPVTVRVPLNKTAQTILERHKDSKRAALLPFVSAQKYNDYIKDCFRCAGITRTVTILDQITREHKQVPICDIASSHMARRTFVGNLYKQVKDPNLVGALSGHKDGSRAFARYRAIDDDIKTELVNLLE